MEPSKYLGLYKKEASLTLCNSLFSMWFCDVMCELYLRSGFVSPQNSFEVIALSWGATVVVSYLQGGNPF